MYRLFISVCFLCLIQTGLAGQTIFVDPANGKDHATGTIKDPLASIDKAVTLASGFSGKEPVTIKLAPGLYTLTRQLLISPFHIENDTAAYTIEAAIMPDDSGWLPSSMPVIQSVSPNNKNYGHFDHCIGFQVERSNTCFKGLKFLGNTHPAVVYYYAIERHRPELKDMKISQCYFIGSKNAAPMQGAVFAQGSGIKIDHCIFYECRNALLLFLSVNGFSLTNSIIYGSYEGAIWFGKYSDFVFRDNIIANNNCFWVGMKDYQPHYVFTHSLVTGNTIDMGLNNNGIIEEDKQGIPGTGNVQRSGKVLLNEISKDTIPVGFLHLLPASAGNDIPAGIFKTNR